MNNSIKFAKVNRWVTEEPQVRQITPDDLPTKEQSIAMINLIREKFFNMSGQTGKSTSLKNKPKIGN